MTEWTNCSGPTEKWDRTWFMKKFSGFRIRRCTIKSSAGFWFCRTVSRLTAGRVPPVDYRMSHFEFWCHRRFASIVRFGFEFDVWHIPRKDLYCFSYFEIARSRGFSTSLFDDDDDNVGLYSGATRALPRHHVCLSTPRLCASKYWYLSWLALVSFTFWQNRRSLAELLYDTLDTEIAVPAMAWLLVSSLCLFCIPISMSQFVQLVYLYPVSSSKLALLSHLVGSRQDVAELVVCHTPSTRIDSGDDFQSPESQLWALAWSCRPSTRHIMSGEEDL